MSQVLLRIIALRLHANRTFRFKGYLEKTTVTTYKRGYIFMRHKKHNLIMSNWLECSLEGTNYKLIPFRKVIFPKQLLVNYSINSSHLIKIDGSLPRSQQPNLGYSESDVARDLHTIGSWSSFWYHRPFTTWSSRLSLPFRLVRTAYSVHRNLSHSRHMYSTIISA